MRKREKGEKVKEERIKRAEEDMNQKGIWSNQLLHQENDNTPCLRGAARCVPPTLIPSTTGFSLWGISFKHSTSLLPCPMKYATSTNVATDSVSPLTTNRSTLHRSFASRSMGIS